MRFTRVLTVALALLLGVTVSAKDEKPALTMVVMDPLAAELSCPCVAGYAQRDYAKLARHLEADLGRPIKVYYAESLGDALKKKTDGKADFIVGKDSVVRAGAKAAGMTVTPIGALTGKDGKTTQTGLFVVPAVDPALTVADLKGYRLLFGPDDCAEKCSAALTLLKESGVPAPEKREVANSCSDGAAKTLDFFKKGEKVSTVVSSYAQPLLEGCGTIKKGELRVVGETDPVPFIVAFVNDKLPSSDRAALEKGLLSVVKDAELCKKMETKSGFVAPNATKKK